MKIEKYRRMRFAETKCNKKKHINKRPENTGFSWFCFRSVVNERLSMIYDEIKRIRLIFRSKIRFLGLKCT
jgi:hypothetical protein